MRENDGSPGRAPLTGRRYFDIRELLLVRSERRCVEFRSSRFGLNSAAGNLFPSRIPITFSWDASESQSKTTKA